MAIDDSAANRPRHGRFFMERMLPETAAQLARIQAGAGSVMELPAEMF